MGVTKTPFGRAAQHLNHLAGSLDLKALNAVNGSDTSPKEILDYVINYALSDKNLVMKSCTLSEEEYYDVWWMLRKRMSQQSIWSGQSVKRRNADGSGFVKVEGTDDDRVWRVAEDLIGKVVLQGDSPWGLISKGGHLLLSDQEVE